MSDPITLARTWAAADCDPESQAELKKLADAAERGDDAAKIELTDRMSGRLAFGTAGLRGVIGAGLRVYLAHRPWPTPVTAWSVLDLGAAAGVMVTASHNPPAYNGYKVYWGNGAQIIPPHDTGIAAASR